MRDGFDRKQNETNEEYQVRLTLMKQNGVDIDWHEIKELLQSDKNPDSLRKESYGIRIYDKYIRDMSKDNTPNNEVELINNKLLELKIEKVKISDLRNLVNKNIKKISKIEDFSELIINECKNIDGFILPDIDVKHEINENGIDSILNLSDIHYDGSSIPIENLFKFTNETIELCRFHNVNRLTVFINGDIINNELKKTIARENRENVSKQMVGVCKYLSYALYKLAENIPYVCVGINTGNHDRSIENYKDSLTTDNYLPVIKEIINLRLGDVSNIVMIDNYVDDRFTLCKIGNKNHVAYHGNGLKNVEKDSIRVVEGFLDVKVDYLHLGHFHSPKEMLSYDSKIIINGSLYNGSDYGKKLLLRTPEIQKLHMLDLDGDIKCTYDVNLNK